MTLRKVIGAARGADGTPSTALVEGLRDLHPARSAQPAGLRGFVVSEVIRRLRGDLSADAFVEEWWDDAAGSRGDAPDGPASVARRLLGSAGIGSAWVTREHVLKRPTYDDAGLLDDGARQRPERRKVIGTAYRREDFTPAAFFDYWRAVHAPISGRVPGLGGYVVSEVLAGWGDIEAEAFVEQWWPDDATLDATADTPELAVAWADVSNYAKTSGTFWVVREHVLIVPPYPTPGSLER